MLALFSRYFSKKSATNTKSAVVRSKRTYSSDAHKAEHKHDEGHGHGHHENPEDEYRRTWMFGFGSVALFGYWLVHPYNPFTYDPIKELAQKEASEASKNAKSLKTHH